MSQPLISIITPAFKAEKTIKRAVDSALRQSFSDWELLIVSDDQQNYEQILKDLDIVDKRLRFLSTNHIGSGSSIARNKALSAARGQYIAALDADDELKPEKLSQLLPLAKKYGAAISDIEFRDNDTYALLEQYNQMPSQEFATVKEIIPACLQTYTIYLYDRSKIPDLYYDPDLLRAQDLVYLMSFFNRLDCIGVIPEKLHIYYRRQGSAFNSADTHQQSHDYKLKIINKLDRGQSSIENKAAQLVLRRYMEFSLDVDKLYDETVLHDPKADWIGIFKAQLQERFFLSRLIN
ncbi:MAG: glycosyltransferase family 2 protein [Cyanobacteriota bacterium]|jgi:succinoglycan biosynthesis protein ExoO